MGGSLATSTEIAKELVRIKTAPQYLVLMSILFSGDLATNEAPYDFLASM